jgi:cytochrome P450
MHVKKKKNIVVDEVRAAFTAKSRTNIASTAKLPYLQAVCEDTLRLKTPVTTSPPAVYLEAQVSRQ